MYRERSDGFVEPETRSSVPEWHFETRSATSVSTVPKAREFFASDRQDIATAAVREILQNALDAAAPSASQAVHVSFRFSTMDADRFRRDWMKGLEPHLAATTQLAREAGVDLFQGIPSHEPVRVLIVEDFHTTGLRGSVDPVRWEEAEVRNFGHFWWKTGSSGKTKESGGRHGIGKATIVELSDLRAFFGASCREDGPNLVLYGQAAFMPHRLSSGGPLIDAYGLFGVVGDNACLPLVDDQAASCCAAVGFDRGGRHGLSLLIPFLKSEVTADSLVSAVIRHAFHQIASGLLTVSVDDVVIDGGSLADLAAADEALSMLIPSIELAFASSSDPHGSERFEPRPEPKGRTSIKTEFLDEVDLVRMRELWDEGRIVDVVFSVPVMRRKSAVEYGRARILMRKEPDRSRSLETAVRGRVTVTHASSKGEYVALLMVETGPLSAFLGDAENVSHTEWSAQRARERYTRPEETLARVKGAFRDLHAGLVGIGDGKTIRNALKQFFFVPVQADRDRPDPEPARRPMPATVRIDAATPKPFKTWQTADGVAIQRDPEVRGRHRGAVEFFYTNAHRSAPRYHEADFDLRGDRIEVLPDPGVVHRVAAGNVIEIDEMPPGAVIRLRGFDPHRELLISIRSTEA